MRNKNAQYQTFEGAWYTIIRHFHEDNEGTGWP